MSRIARDLGTVGGTGQIEEWSRDEAGLDGLCHHLYGMTGIAFPPSAKNRSLMVSRLSSVLRRRRFTSLRAYLRELRSRRPEAAQHRVHLGTDHQHDAVFQGARAVRGAAA